MRAKSRAMTDEDSSDDDDMPTAEEEAAYERWRLAGKQAVQSVSPEQRSTEPGSTEEGNEQGHDERERTHGAEQARGASWITPEVEPAVWSTLRLKLACDVSEEQTSRPEGADGSTRVPVEESVATAGIRRAWERRFAQLQDFKRQHGHLHFTEADEPVPGLAGWRKMQRVRMRKGTLTAVEQDWLDSIGFEWLAPDQLFSDRKENAEAVWRAHYAALLRFKERHGHTEVTEAYKDAPKLAFWVQRQRQYARRGQLQETYRRLLDEVGFSWQSDLKCHEMHWEERFSQIAAFIREHGQDALTESNEPVPGLVEWRDNQRAHYRKGKMLPERVARLEEIGFTWRAVDRYKRAAGLEKLWRKRFAELILYKEKHGHTEVPASFKGNKKLGRWVGKQREKFVLSQLLPGHREALEGIGFAWKCGRIHHRALWEKNFARMAAFIQRHGHDRVSQRDAAFPSLGQWQILQRVNLRRGTLLPERKARLDAIGFTWTRPVSVGPNPEFEAAWEKRFTELLAFKERHGHTEVPANWKEYPYLETWITKQRTQRTRGTLRPDRQQRLEDAGFAWRGTARRFKSQWEAAFAQLVAFHREHGHYRVTHTMDPKLASWCADHKSKYRQGTLRPERQARLEGIGFEWTTPPPTVPLLRIAAAEARWEMMMLQLQAYVAQHGHANVPHLWKKNRALGSWTHKQRQCHTAGTLRADRTARLDALGFVWRRRPSKGPRTEEQKRRRAAAHATRREVDTLTLWERGFAALREFHLEHGHVKVPKSDPEQWALVRWLRQQGVARKRGSLLFAQAARMEQLGHEWA